MNVLFQRGVYLPGIDLWMDSQAPRPIAFVSHAHSDHIQQHGYTLATPATAALPAWPAYTADHRATMVFDTSVSVVDAPLEAERAVWASAWEERPTMVQ